MFFPIGLPPSFEGGEVVVTLGRFHRVEKAQPWAKSQGEEAANAEQEGASGKREEKETKD
jgi:hypothetical protein